ncbi:hypothetical protein [Streptomyces sp. DT17]
MDTLVHWQTLRGLAYLSALSTRTIDGSLKRDLEVIPGQSTAAYEGTPALLGRLEEHASSVPMPVLDPIVRDCDILLRGSRHAGYAIGTELAEDSLPRRTDEAIARTALLTSYWYESPGLRGGLTLVWSTNQFVRRWLRWSHHYPDGIVPPGSPGIATSPAPPLPALSVFPSWASPLLSRLKS